MNRVQLGVTLTSENLFVKTMSRLIERLHNKLTKQKKNSAIYI